MLLIALTALSLSATPAPIEYFFRISDDMPGPSSATGILRMAGDMDGETLFILPSQWGGEDELWRSIRYITVNGEHVMVREANDRFTVTHEPGEMLTVMWSVEQEDDRPGGPELERNDNYRPWLQREYAYLIGHTAFVVPDLPQDTPITISFTMPYFWTLASDLEDGEATISELLQSIIAAGDFRIVERNVGGAPVRVAVRGEINDTQIIAATETAVRGNLAYWGDRSEPYLVTALPLIAEPGYASFGGTNLADAFALYSAGDIPQPILQRILVHEHAHTWVPLRLGGMSPGPEQPGEYWFSEGFTDFVTTRAGLLSGAWDADTALEQWNEFLSEYMSNPEREAPNSAIRDGFWSSYELNRLPYLRGNLFAALVDYTILTETEGRLDIDDVLLAMRDAPDRGPAALTFVGTTREVTGLDITALYQRHIVEGETIILPADAFGSCGVVESGMQPVFVYGMTLEANPDGDGFLLDSVDPEGPAARAGFEAGMVMLERVAGAVGDATQPSAFRMIDLAGEERVMSYLPTNGQEELVQRILPADGDLMANGCAQRLAGRPL